MTNVSTKQKANKIMSPKSTIEKPEIDIFSIENLPDSMKKIINSKKKDTKDSKIIEIFETNPIPLNADMIWRGFYNKFGVEENIQMIRSSLSKMSREGLLTRVKVGTYILSKKLNK